MKRNKYGAIRTELDGIWFASKKEAYRYATLKILEKGNAIRNLEIQPKYPLGVNGQIIATYIADFRYIDLRTGKLVVEDVKSVATKTPVFNLKRKLLKALYGIEVTVV